MSNYFEFSAAEKKYLESINKSNDERLSEYASKSSDAVRLKTPRYDIIRPQYSYDTDCIIHSPLYNRYSDKTQVFSFYKNDDITRRALHVQFVSKIARTIGRALNLNLDLIEAIALGHDTGHTPFGHKGEEFLSKCYQEGCKKAGKPIRFFNHNVHSARLYRYILGTNISLQTLSGILSHNGEKGYKEYRPSKLESFEEFDEILEHCYLDNNYHKKLRPNGAELDSHQNRTTPKEILVKWANSMINIQGDIDRHLELCYDGDSLIGFLYGKIDHPNHKGFIKIGYGYIMEFYVLPEFRRNGYGKQMYSHLEELLISDGAKGLYLTSDPVTGKPFWEACGYKNTDQSSPENNQEIYEKSL